MLKKLTLAILAAAFVVSPVVAQNPDGSITLTPSKLYELIQETRGQAANVASMLKDRIKKSDQLHADHFTAQHVLINNLDKRVYALEHTSPINPSDTLRIQTLEKKVHSLTEIVKMMRERRSSGGVTQIQSNAVSIEN